MINDGQSLREFYDSVAAEYYDQEFHPVSFAAAAAHRAIRDELLRRLPGRMLELGCGADACNDQGRVVGVDLSYQMLFERSRVNLRCLSIQADARALPVVGQFES